MKYPIDTEACKAVLQRKYGSDSDALNFCYACALFLNKAYCDGRSGASGWPADPAAEIAAHEKSYGPVNDKSKQVVTMALHRMNEAYAQGQQEAEGPNRGGEAD